VLPTDQLFWTRAILTSKSRSALNNLLLIPNNPWQYLFQLKLYSTPCQRNAKNRGFGH